MTDFTDIVSTTEICKMMGIKRQQLWILRSRDFPKPRFTLAVGPIWLRSDIYQYLDTWEGISPPGRPRKSSSEPLSAPS